MVTARQLADFAALLCGILTATGVLGICAIFGLYALEDRLRRDDDVNNPSPAQRRDWFANNFEGRTLTVPIVLTESDARRFLAKVRTPNENGCMLWTARTSKATGYGQFYLHGRTTYAHRVAYVLANGAIPDGLQIDHTCHVRDCCAPLHLRLATKKQNCENLSGAQANSSTGIRGVSWSARSEKWRACLSHHGRTVHLGYYDDIEVAAKVAREARLNLFTHNDMDRYPMLSDPDELADYLAQLAHEAEHGPGAGQETQ